MIRHFIRSARLVTMGSIALVVSQPAIAQQCGLGPSTLKLAPQSPVATSGLAPVKETANAARLVHAYECNGDPFLCVGPEDWLSLGASQWNFGTGSAQSRLLKDIPASVFSASMPKYGATLFQLAGPGISKAEVQATLQGWRNGGKIRDDVEAELKALLATPELQARQLQLVKADADKAYQLAAAWAYERRQSLPTFREFAFFMDAQVFSGGYRHVWAPALQAFEQQYMVNGTLDRRRILLAIAQWYRGCPPARYGQKDAAWNAERLEGMDAGSIAAPAFDLLVLGFLRAMASEGCNTHKDAQGKCLPEWEGVFRIHVLDRAASLSLGRARHNGTVYEPYKTMDPDQLVLPSQL